MQFVSKSKLRRRSLLGSGSTIDWETIARGMTDYSTPFSLPAELVTSVPNYAYYGRTNLTAVEIAGGVETIGTAAFQNCSALISITLPNAVTTITSNAFNSSGITSITIPSPVTSIGSNAFYNCTYLGYVVIQATTPPTLGNGNVFSRTNNCPIYVPDESVEAYKAAANWSSLASRIFPLSDFSGGVIDNQQVSGISAERSAA